MDEFVSLPEHPSRRRIILILNQVNIDRLDIEDSRDLAQRRDVTILNSEQTNFETEGLLGTLARRGLLQPGSALVQSPFNESEYVDVVEANEVFAREKFNVMSGLCLRLGARSLEVTAVEDERSNARWDAELSATKQAGANGTGTVSQSAAESLRRQLHLNDKFSGGPADIEGARDFLVNRRLDHDRELVSLIDARSVENNQHLERTLMLDLSQESKRVLELVGSLVVPGFVKANAKWSKAVENAAKYKLEYTVRY